MESIIGIIIFLLMFCFAGRKNIGDFSKGGFERKRQEWMRQFGLGGQEDNQPGQPEAIDREKSMRPGEELKEKQAQTPAEKEDGHEGIFDAIKDLPERLKEKFGAFVQQLEPAREPQAAAPRQSMEAEQAHIHPSRTTYSIREDAFIESSLGENSPQGCEDLALVRLVEKPGQPLTAGGLNLQDLRQAIIMAEILDRPVALRNKAR